MTTAIFRYVAPALLVAAAASAATIKTYRFTQTGYQNLVFPTGLETTLTGTFTAVPDALGRIAAKDLLAFDAVFETAAPPSVVRFSLGFPQLFSFDTLGGPATFALVASLNIPGAAPGAAVCVGAPAAFAAAPCPQASAIGTASTGLYVYGTANFPTIELLSSIVALPTPSTTPPVVLGTPEPATAGLLCAGIGLVALGRRKAPRRQQ